MRPKMSHDQKVVMEKFKVDDVIRSVNPYWGEPSYKIVEFAKHDVSCVRNGSIHGPAWEREGSIESLGYGQFVDDVYDTFNYVKCSYFMRIWLWILGNTYGRL